MGGFPSSRRVWRTALLALLCAPSVAAQGVRMLPATRVETHSEGSGGVAASDLDLDGVLDLVIANGTSQFDPVKGFRVFLGRPDGTFDAGVAYAGPYNEEFAIADFTGDGFPDLVGGDFNEQPSHRVWVFPSLGDGSFGAPVKTSLGVDHHSIAFAPGDFDGDGLPDLAVYSSGNFSSLRFGRGNGDGSFGPFVAIYNLQAPFGTVIAADVDLDGRLDLVLGLGLRVFRGNGDGTFQAPIVNSSLPFAGWSRLFIADLDADGLPDLVSGGAISATVHQGHGDGTFTEVVQYSWNVHEDDMQLVDLDDDGGLDLLGCRPMHVGFPEPPGLTVRLGLPGLAFGTPDFYRTGGSPLRIATGDFDGDGILDAALGQELLGSASEPRDLALVFGRGDGGFAVSTYVDVLAPPLATELADMNGDGHLDLVTTVAKTLPAVRVALGHGDGSFDPPVGVDVGDNDGELAVADFDGDGVQDLLVAGNPPGATVVALGSGDGVSFDPPLLAATSDVADLRAADFDADGAQDFAVTRTLSGVITVYLGDGLGGFADGIYLSAGGHPTGMVLADLNDDDRVDIAVADTADARVGVLLNLGGGAFAPPQTLPAPGKPLHVVAGDFDGDGLMDLATADEQPKRVSIFLGTGGGSFAAPITSGLAHISRSMAAVDANRDGVLDLIDVHGAQPLPFPPFELEDLMGSVSLLLGRGDGSFLPRRMFYAGANPLDLAIGDVDEDGFPDVAVTCHTEKEVWLLPNLSEPWENLGFSLAAPSGTPALSGSGEPVGTEQVTLLATGVPAASSGLLFVGLTTGMQPLQGGTLVPFPTIAVPIAPRVPLHGRWSPAISPGTTVYFQAWFLTPPGGDVAATNALLTIGE